MSDTNLEMGKKRSRQQQSSNVAVVADSSESGDGATDKISANKQNCSHVTRSVDGNQIKKNISQYINGKKLCPHCKEGNEEDISKTVEDDFWVCLRCGAKTCSLEHSAFHYNVPRSDSHALTLKIPAFTVWCHVCKADISSDCNKKLKTCISSIEQLYNKQINLQPLSQQETKNGSKNAEEDDVSKENKLNEPIPLPPPKKAPTFSPPVVRGLTNLGNTCFFNSVLQCLAQTPGLVDAIREMAKPDQEVDIVLKNGAKLAGKLGQWDNLSECLVDTLIKLQSGGPVVSPDRLHSLLTKKQVQFQGYRQHDAHELFTYLIDTVRMIDQKRYRKLILTEFGLEEKTDRQNVPEEITKKLKALDHEVAESVSFAPEKVFKGRLVNRIECQECHSVKMFEESFMDLSLPIVPDKPQPPCMRRKGGHQQYHQNQSQAEAVQEDDKYGSIAYGTSGTGMSKSQLKKEKKLQRKKNRGKNNSSVNDQKKEEDNSEFAAALLVEDHRAVNDGKDHEQQQDSDVEGDIEDNSEETNSGSKCKITKDAVVPSESVGTSSDVNCGNQGVWLESNESPSSPAYREITEKHETDCETNNCLQEQEFLIADLLGMEDITSSKHNLDNNELIDVKEEVEEELKHSPPAASSTVYLQDNNLEGKSLECNNQRRNCEDQVTAWLNTSNLMSPPDGDEAHTDETSPPLINVRTSSTANSPSSHHTHSSSVCSNQLNVGKYWRKSPDETRSSSLLRTATQETQESGYCSEKLGCAESPHREGSPCSLNGFSAPSSGVEGAISSRSDVSIEEVLNNTNAAIAEEDESTETADVAAASCNNEVLSIDLWNHKNSWTSHNCSCVTSIRRQELQSLLDSENPSSYQETVGSISKKNSRICSKCQTEENKVPPFESKTILEGEEEGDIGNHDLFEFSLGSIPEMEGISFDVVYGPLNKDQLVLGDLLGSDNSNDLSSSAAQGLIARPGSPCDETYESSDLKNLEINTFNEEDSPSLYKPENIFDEQKADDHLGAADNVHIVPNVGAAGVREPDYGSSCGCYKTCSRQDSVDNCCLHTSLAQSTQAELMTGCNKIACDNCSSGNPDGKSVCTNSTKQTLISQAPPALVIHLKRFQVQMMTCRKLSRHVSFPLQLDLTPYSVSNVQINATDGVKKSDVNKTKSDLVYTLYGIVEHSGTMNGGHYVAYVKISRDDNSHYWYCISDSHVSMVSEARVLSAQAYLLFYKRSCST